MAAPQQMVEIGTLRMVPMQTSVLEKGRLFDSGIYNPGLGPLIRFSVTTPYGPASQALVNDAMRISLCASLLHPGLCGRYFHARIRIDPTAAAGWTSMTTTDELPKGFQA